MAKHVPMRKCMGCQKMVPKNECIRIIKQLDQPIRIDETGKAQGRGAYICRKQACIEKVVIGSGLERSFKMRISSEIKEALLREMSNIEKQ